MYKLEKTTLINLPNCLRLTNGEIEVIVTTDAGPRILHYSFAGGENILGLYPEKAVETALGEFKPYGGHRLWIAPEKMPESYAPDNSPVEYDFDETKNSIRLTQNIEPATQMQKEMTIALDAEGSGVSIRHKITNRGTETVERAPWAITILRGGGEALIPNAPYAPHGSETLLPVRNLALWAYSDLSDSRWRFGENFIHLRVDSEKKRAIKIGVSNKEGWTSYTSGNLKFIKRFDFVEGVNYPDMNSNNEVYTQGEYIEIESLAPLTKLASGEFVEHTERWELSESFG